MKTLTIGQVAKGAGIGVETVRFYERQGLLEAPERRPSGYRQFDEEIVARLRFIRQAKELGFTLHEIKELLSLRFDPSTTCADVKNRAEAKIADIEAKIVSLRRMKQALEKLTKARRGRGTTSDCPILDALDGREEVCRLCRYWHKRHTFAVHRLTAWYQQGADVQRLVYDLSVYLGHARLPHTQVYLTLTPELLQQAVRRFERYARREENHA